MTKSFYAGIVALAFIVSTAFAVDGFYERKAAATDQFERMAADEEVARLQFSLQLIELRIEKYKDLAALRPLSEAEQIELRSLEAQRAAILSRMAQKA